jgi:protein-tyrosine phosphatase
MRRIAGYSLWIGNVGDAHDVDCLHAKGILAVVDLALNESPVALPRELMHCRFPLLDGPGNPAWLLRTAIDTVACLVRDGVPTLVCCGAGMSRSPCVAGAAIARVRRCPLGDGLAIVLESGRSDVSPALWSEVQSLFDQE